MRGKEFSLQLDEATTSINNKDTYLICYVRFIDNDDNIVEDLLFCKPILTNCTAQELFKILNNFIQKIKPRVEILRWFVHRWYPSYVWSFGRAANFSAGRCCRCKMNPLHNTP